VCSSDLVWRRGGGVGRRGETEARRGERNGDCTRRCPPGAVPVSFQRVGQPFSGDPKGSAFGGPQYLHAGIIVAGEHMSRHLPVVIEQDEDGVFIVSVPTLRGCHSYGQTIEEAMANLKEAVELCLEDEQPGESSRFIGVRDLEIVQ
jgi:predicted RNase H-like HicB family nuclease